jgi:hypothetical protein
MNDTTTFHTDFSRKSSVLREFIELVLDSFRADGAVKNEWLMPFDPGPSSFKRKAMSGKSR